jgi:hypothetical protein
MKQSLLLLVVIALASWAMPAQAQSIKVQRRIMVTDTIGTGNAKVAVSSDDAEQENDKMDSLHDDDIDAGWEGDPEDRNILTAGLRFRNLTLPKGAVIDSAFIVLYSHEGKSVEDVAKLTFVGDANDNAPTFTIDSLIDKRARTAANVRWTVAEEWKIWQPYRTPDLKSIVQEVVNRPGWKSGNALAFIVLGEDQGPSEVDNAREWEAFENISDPEDGGDGQNHPERVPELYVYYSMPVGVNKIQVSIQVTDTIGTGDAKIAVSSDDAEQENDKMDSLHDDDIDAGWEGDPEDRNILTAGLRFRDIALPQGAVIDSAFLILHSHEGKSVEDVAKLTIVGDANDNAPTFTIDSLIDKRARTVANVRWTVAEEWKIWQPYRTPDLKSIVQEIVNRPGWKSGNALAFIILGEDQGPSEVDNAREWEAFENISDPEDGGDGQNHPERRPQLVIYFSTATGSYTRTLSGNDVEELKIYPNPVSDGEVMIELENEETSLLRVFNANGQLVKTQKNEFGKMIRLFTGNLSNGVYYLQATQSQKRYVQKLIVQE